jgi:hypothetical protein
VVNPRGFSQTGIELLNAELAKRGISSAAASGAIAGIMGESGASLDPASFNSKDPGGGSGGIGQWNRGRLIGPNGMLAFAKHAGIDVDPSNPLDAKKVPLATQVQYLGHELDTTYAGVRSQLQAAKSPQDALNVWVNSYENPADKRGAIAQRSQYLAPVGQTLNSLPASSGSPPPPTTAAGAPNSVAGAPAAPAATPAPGTTLPGFQPGSKANEMAQAGLKQLAGGGGQGGGAGAEEPPKIQPPPMVPAQAVGGAMMMGPGGQNTMGQRMAEQALAQKGFLTQPSLAAFTPGMPQQPMTPPGAATGIPGLPGTTLNSPSQLQMALMNGAMNPYDLYASGGYGGAGGFQGSA